MRHLLVMVVVMLASVAWASDPPTQRTCPAPLGNAPAYDYIEHRTGYRAFDKKLSIFCANSEPYWDTQYSRWMKSYHAYACSGESQWGSVGRKEGPNWWTPNYNSWVYYDEVGCPYHYVAPEDPPPEPMGPEWVVFDDIVDCPGSVWAYRPHFHEDESVTYDTTWSTPCGGARSRFGLDAAEYAAELAVFEAMCVEVCTDPRDDYGEEPTPSDPPVNPSECIGLSGLACESTLRDIRELLAKQVAREQDTVVPPTPPVVIEPETFYMPPFDQSQPTWEDWVVPEVDEDARADAAAYLSFALGELRDTAATKFPFGLGSWVPLLSVAAGPECVELEFHVMGITDDLGWCGSAVESALATTIRAAMLVVALIAFSFAVLRTVSWA